MNKAQLLTALSMIPDDNTELIATFTDADHWCYTINCTITGAKVTMTQDGNLDICLQLLEVKRNPDTHEEAAA